MRTTHFHKMLSIQGVSLESISIYIFVGIGFLSIGIRQPILPLYLSEIGISVQTIGLLYSLYTLASIIGDFFWGWMLDRYPARWLMLCGALVHGLSVAGFLWASTEFGWYLAHFIYGVTQSPILLLGRWYQGVFAPLDSKTVGQARISLIISITMGIGAIVGGWIGNLFGLRSTFYAMMFPLLFVGIGLLPFMSRLRFEPPDSKDVSLEIQNPTQPRAHSNNHPLFIISGLSAMFFVSFGIISTYFSLFANEVYGLDAGRIGMIVGFHFFIRMLLTMPLSRLGDRHGKGRLILLGVLLMGVASLAIPLSPGFVLLIVSMIIYAIALIFFLPTAVAWLADRVSPSRQGSMMGKLSAIENSGWLISPVIGGYLWERFGARSVFFFSAGVAGITLIVALAGGWFRPGAGKSSSD